MLPFIITGTNIEIKRERVFVPFSPRTVKYYAED